MTSVSIPIVRRALLAAGLLLATAEPLAARTLTHRVWLLGGVPDAPVLQALRAAGVGGTVIPVGTLELERRTCRLKLVPLADVAVLSELAPSALVWLDAQDPVTADPAAFAAQLAPVQRLFPAGASVVLAARRYVPGLAAFAGAAARELKQTVELALPAPELQRHLADESWTATPLIAIALGNPAALSLPSMPPQDDLAALAELDARGLRYRVAMAVTASVQPVPGAGGASLAQLASDAAAAYRPGERGDVFELRRALDWGGVALAPGQLITVEAVDAARYHRDLALVLRPVRGLLEGWDTVGLPANEPTLGMSRAAFLDYLRGGSFAPTPRIEAAAVSGTAVRVTLSNPGAQASAFAPSANWVEIHFSGTEIRDVQLGDFAGVSYGRRRSSGFEPVVVRDATDVRLILRYLPPHARVSGGVVRFLSRPRALSARWNVRLGDGSEIRGEETALALTSP
jgi:hypothetical protein